MVDRVTATTWDAVGSVCAELTGIRWVRALGVTASVRYETDLVIAQAHEFLESGLPQVVVGLGPWSVIAGHAERRTYEFRIGLCFPVQPLGEVLPLMADAIDELVAGFEEHSKAKLHGAMPGWDIGSALVTRGEGITPRVVRGIVEQQPDRPYLIAPASVEVKVNRTAGYRPA
jgi:hypothetical protein